MSDIEPGRVHSPTGTTIATSSGVFTMPQSNTAWLAGSEPLIGIDTEASGSNSWQRGDEITVVIRDARIVQGNAVVPSGYGMIQLGQQFVDPTNPSAGQQLQATSFSVLRFVFDGGVSWILSSQPGIQ